MIFNLALASYQYFGSDGLGGFNEAARRGGIGDSILSGSESLQDASTALSDGATMIGGTAGEVMKSTKNKNSKDTVLPQAGTKSASGLQAGKARTGGFGGGETEAANQADGTKGKFDSDGRGSYLGGGGSFSNRQAGNGKSAGNLGVGASGSGSASFSGSNSADGLLPIEDPEDYFSRIPVSANLFEVIERRYRKKTLDWKMEKLNLKLPDIPSRKKGER